MSRIQVLVRPGLITGFQLAGVEAFSAEDVESAQQLIEGWLQSGESTLVAIEEDLLTSLEPKLIRRLDGSETLLYVAIPSGVSPMLVQTRRARISQMIQRAIGVHITFEGENGQHMR